MGGESSQQQQTSSQTDPWKPTMPVLQNILSGIGGINAAPTSAQTGALGSIMGNAQGTQNYGTQATSLANNLMSGGGTGANAGILSNAYSQYQNQMNPVATQNNDPMQTPGIQSLLDTIRGDVSNQVNGQFAGAGRDLSGMNQQALARGISQGEAAPLLGQYNQNVQNQQNASNGLLGAGLNTANGLQNFNQQGYQNQATGLDTAMQGIPAAQNNQANQVLGAGQQAYSLPIQNLAQILGLTLPIAGLGSQSSGQSTTTNQMSGAQQFATIAGGVGSLFGAPKGGVSPAGNIMNGVGTASNTAGGLFGSLFR